MGTPEAFSESESGLRIPQRSKTIDRGPVAFGPEYSGANAGSARLGYPSSRRMIHEEIRCPPRFMRIGASYGDAVVFKGWNARTCSAEMIACKRRIHPFACSEEVIQLVPSACVTSPKSAGRRGIREFGLGKSGILQAYRIPKFH